MWPPKRPDIASPNRPQDKGEEKLDRALVAGLILEVILEAPEDLAGGTTRPQAVKSKIKSYLVEHLAGKVTLDRFRSLATRLDCWFEFYYPLLTPSTPAPQATSPWSGVYYASEETARYQVGEPRSSYSHSLSSQEPERPARPVFWEELLDRWLAELEQALPQRPHRKISRRKVKDFLQRTAGGWFKLRDFERYFQIDRKTAWDYLQQFLQAGLVCHNRKQSAAVRYCAAPALLKVEADTLRLALGLILPEVPEAEVERLGDLLVASGGQPLLEKEWREHFKAEQGDRLLQTLMAHNILAVQVAATGTRLLRLRRRWLQTAAPGGY